MKHCYISSAAIKINDLLKLLIQSFPNLPTTTFVFPIRPKISLSFPTSWLIVLPGQNIPVISYILADSAVQVAFLLEFLSSLFF